MQSANLKRHSITPGSYISNGVYRGMTVAISCQLKYQINIYSLLLKSSIGIVESITYEAFLICSFALKRWARNSQYTTIQMIYDVLPEIKPKVTWIIARGKISFCVLTIEASSFLDFIANVEAAQFLNISYYALSKPNSRSSWRNEQSSYRLYYNFWQNRAKQHREMSKCHVNKRLFTRVNRNNLNKMYAILISPSSKEW